MKTRFSNKRTALLTTGVISTLVLSFLLLLSPSISVSLARSSNRHDVPILTPADETATVKSAIDSLNSINDKATQTAKDDKKDKNNQNDSGNQNVDNSANGAGDACG